MIEQAPEDTATTDSGGKHSGESDSKVERATGTGDGGIDPTGT